MTAETGGIPQDMAMFRKPVLDMKPYSPPIEGRTKKNYLRLDFNERTRPAHPLVYDEIQRELDKRRLHLYPEYGDLDKVLAKFAGVKPEQIIPTVGGDQGIDIIYRSAVSDGLNPDSLSEDLRQKMQDFMSSLTEGEKGELLDGDDTVMASPTFAMLEQSARVQGAKMISPRYNGPTLEFPFDEVMQDIKPGVKLVVICNPNNPTGTPVPKERIESIIKRAAEVDADVLVDEAYSDFVPELTVVPLVDNYGNLFVVKSLSKNMGIAGLRPGYVISQAKNIAQLRKIRGPYDLSSLSAVAMKALRYKEVVADIKNYVLEVMTVSKPTIEAFYQENGIRYFPSSAGFHLLEFADKKQRDGFVAFLKKQHEILVRPRPDPSNTVRVSIGTKQDTQKYIEAFSDFLKSRAA